MKRGKGISVRAAGKEGENEFTVIPFLNFDSSEKRQFNLLKIVVCLLRKCFLVCDYCHMFSYDL
jgi:hypothetical protein